MANVVLSVLFTSVFLLLCIASTPTSASSILVFHLMATSSHRTSIWPLVERLANNGHNITYIFPCQNRDGSHPNVEELVPSKMVPIVKEIAGDFDINFRLNNSIDDWTWQIFARCADICEAFYDSPETLEWLSRPVLKYDLVMIDSSLGECVYGLVHRFKAKHLIFAPLIPDFIWDGLGLVPETSSIPEIYFHRKPAEMGFVSRLLTTLAPLIFRLAFLDYVRRIEPSIKTKLNMPDMPSLLEFERNTSLVLLNSHFIEDYPMALPPMIVSYSGLWCAKDTRDKARKPLPQDISTFINQGGDSENQGFIYVSFGSAVVISGLPDSSIQHFFKAFAAFPQLKFLWRWTGSIPENKPENVMFKDWFPQRDLLAHSKIKGFVTQAGRPSTQEALCYGVPMISFPIFADQDNNANRLEHLGISMIYDITNFTAETLQTGINELLQNPSYSIKMKEMSAMFRDRPIDPVDNALYWTEYVLRYNTSVLKPLGMNQTWWQRRLFDVYAAIFLGIAVIIGVSLLIMYLLIKLIMKLVSSAKAKKEDKKKIM